MKKTTILLFAAILLAACQPGAVSEPTVTLSTKTPSTQDLVNAWQDALNKGDVDAALSYLADDATVTIIPPAEGDGIYNGHAEIRGWYEAIVAAKGSGTLSDCQENGEAVTCADTYADEGLKALGVDFIEGTWEAVIRNGKIQSYTFTMSPESLAKFPVPETEPAIDPIVQQLAGKYLTTITLQESQTNPDIDAGDYLLKLQTDMRWFVTDLAGFVIVQGYFTVTADQIALETKSGPAAGACIGLFATYAWSLDGETLTLTAIEDECPGSRFFLTIHPFVRQP